MEDIEEAKKALAKKRCSYIKKLSLYSVEEYALEYCECDTDGSLSPEVTMTWQKNSQTNFCGRGELYSYVDGKC